MILWIVLSAVTLEGHWPGEGELQKGNAQKVTFMSLKSDLKETFK